MVDVFQLEKNWAGHCLQSMDGGYTFPSSRDLYDEAVEFLTEKQSLNGESSRK